MKKYFLTYFVLTCFILQNTSQIWIITSFYIQRDFIAKTLCENRFNKDSQCDGKCFLTHELKENNKKQEEQFPDLKVQELQLFSAPYALADLFQNKFLNSDSKIHIPDSIGICSEIAFSIFHPPQFI